MPTPFLVSAASSLTDVLPRIGQAWAKTARQPAPRFNFGASGTLLKQINAGAPVDVFASVGVEEMISLRNTNRLAFAYTVFAGNGLVLIAPSMGAASVIHDWNDLKKPQVKRIAISNPSTVPSGWLAHEILERKHLWSALQPKFVKGENVRQTLAYAARGDADAAIVFATDARIERRVRVVARAKADDLTLPITYTAGVLARSAHKNEARLFTQFLTTQPAQALLRNFGFTPPPALPIID